jgi:hypothetical protein
MDAVGPLALTERERGIMLRTSLGDMLERCQWARRFVQGMQRGRVHDWGGEEDGGGACLSGTFLMQQSLLAQALSP